MSDHVKFLRGEAELTVADGVPSLGAKFSAAADELERLEAVAKACIEVDTIQPVMPQIMDMVRRWQEGSES